MSFRTLKIYPSLNPITRSVLGSIHLPSGIVKFLKFCLLLFGFRRKKSGPDCFLINVWIFIFRHIVKFTGSKLPVGTLWIRGYYIYKCNIYENIMRMWECLFETILKYEFLHTNKVMDNYYGRLNSKLLQPVWINTRNIITHWRSIEMTIVTFYCVTQHTMHQ